MLCYTGQVYEVIQVFSYIGVLHYMSFIYKITCVYLSIYITQVSQVIRCYYIVKLCYIKELN